LRTFKYFISLTFFLVCAFYSGDQEIGDTTRTFSGLKYVILEKGGGKQAYAYRRVNIDYIGSFTSGEVFDSSKAEGYSFVLATGQVISGLDEGVRLMSVGDRYLFIIPWKLAYGKKGIPGAIPPRETLIFEVVLNSVEEI